MNPKAKRPLLFFTIIWTCAILIFDCIVFYGIWWQCRALTFAVTNGVVTASELTHHSSSEGSSTGIRIEYDYTVDRVSYHGDRYRYGAGSSSDSDWAVAALREFPVGAHILVHYRAEKPDESVLKPGLDGSNLFLMLFLTPFNTIMLLLWALAYISRSGRLKNRVAGGVAIRSRGPRTIISLPTLPPLAAGFCTLGLCSFAGIFVIGFFAGGFHPSWRLATKGWLVVLALSVISYVWMYLRILQGKYDIILDDTSRTLTLPPTFKRKQPVKISYAEVASVNVETVSRASGDNADFPTYAPTVTFRDDKSPPARLALWGDEDRATAFASWLDQRVRA